MGAEGNRIVAVFGSSVLSEQDPAWNDVCRLGALLAGAGMAVMTGGYGGAMAAASKGAREAGGRVIGVTVELFERRGPVNRWVGERLHTPDLFERLRTLARLADAFVVVQGSVGTLTELFLAWTLVSVGPGEPRPLILMGAHWTRLLEVLRSPGFVPAHLFPLVRAAPTPEDVLGCLAGPVRNAEAGGTVR